MTESQKADVIIVLRAMVTLRGMQIALKDHCRHPRSVAFGRLMTAVRQMEAQVDAALETVRPLVNDSLDAAADD